MNRNEIISLLIEDRIGDWVHAHNTDGLEEVLVLGWKGYENYTNQELQEAFEELIEDNFDEETARKIRAEKIRLGITS